MPVPLQQPSNPHRQRTRRYVLYTRSTRDRTPANVIINASLPGPIQPMPVNPYPRLLPPAANHPPIATAPYNQDFLA